MSKVNILWEQYIISIRKRVNHNSTETYALLGFQLYHLYSKWLQCHQVWVDKRAGDCCVPKPNHMNNEVTGIIYNSRSNQQQHHLQKDLKTDTPKQIIRKRTTEQKWNFLTNSRKQYNIMITHCLFSTKSTFVCTDNNKITTLSSFEYVTI